MSVTLCNIIVLTLCCYVDSLFSVNSHTNNRYRFNHLYRQYEHM
jgi:hypothetical protein